MTWQGSNATTYSAYVSYVWDYGLRGMPVAGPAGTPLEAITEHAPACYKVVSWCCQGYDGTPSPPDPDTQSTNEVLTMKAVGSPFQGEMADGTIVTTIAGVYIYLLLIPPSNTDNLVIGKPPYDLSLFETILPADFMKGLLGPSGQPTGQGPYG